MIQHITYVYQFNLGFAEKLVKDLSPEQMVQQQMLETTYFMKTEQVRRVLVI